MAVVAGSDPASVVVAGLAGAASTASCGELTVSSAASVVVVVWSCV